MPLSGNSDREKLGKTWPLRSVRDAGLVLPKLWYGGAPRL
jgi:hypothetical protein